MVSKELRGAHRLSALACKPRVVPALDSGADFWTHGVGGAANLTTDFDSHASVGAESDSCGFIELCGHPSTYPKNRATCLESTLLEVKIRQTRFSSEPLGLEPSRQ